MRIFPENLATFEQKKIVQKYGKDFVNLIETLISEASVSIQKHAGFRGEDPVGA